jgi:hypothetical protein
MKTACYQKIAREHCGKISKQVDTQKIFKVTVSKIEPEIIKPVTPSNYSVENA